MLQSDQQNSLMGLCLIFGKKIVIVMIIRDFPGGPVVNNLPSMVHGDDPERCCGEGGGRGVHVWEHM